VEPAHAEEVTPWWRGIDSPERAARPADVSVQTMPKSVPWPID